MKLELYEIITDNSNTISSFYKMLIFAYCEEEARSIAEPYCNKIIKCTKLPYIPSIISHESILTNFLK